MFEQAISPETKESLDLVKRLPFIKKAYLAGGTGLSLQLGHRLSFDLDFFSEIKFDSGTLIQKLAETGGFRLESESWQTVIGSLNSVKISYFYYQYPLIAKMVDFKGVSLASVPDIAAMKIAAIADRGVKRDFIDLYFIIKNRGYSVDELLRFYNEKYKVLDVNMIHLRKSLVYFDDGESDPMPQMIKEVNWQEVKKELRERVLQSLTTHST